MGATSEHHRNIIVTNFIPRFDDPYHERYKNHEARLAGRCRGCWIEVPKPKTGFRPSHCKKCRTLLGNLTHTHGKDAADWYDLIDRECHCGKPVRFPFSRACLYCSVECATAAKCNWAREKYRTDADFRRRERERCNALLKRQYATNPAVRERIIRSTRERTASGIAREQQRERYRTDPAYRQRAIESASKRVIARKRRLRAEMFMEQKGRCGLCHKPMVLADTHIDHIVPVSRGGRNERNNLWLLHAACNMAKHTDLITSLPFRP